MLQSPHSAVATFTEAIRADPDYAFAYAGRPVARSLARIRRFRPGLGVRTWCRRLQHVAWDQLLPKRRHTEAEMMLAKVRPIAQDRLAEG